MNLYFLLLLFVGCSKIILIVFRNIFFIIFRKMLFIFFFDSLEMELLFVFDLVVRSGRVFFELDIFEFRQILLELDQTGIVGLFGRTQVIIGGINRI